MKYNRNTSPIIGNKEPIDIIIPAAGSGKRLRSYGCKPLLKISPTETIVSRQIKKIRKFFKNSTIILVCGFESDILMQNTPNDIIKIENERFEETNVVRSIGLGLRASCSEAVMVLYGDLVFNDHAIKSIETDKSCLLIDKNGIMGNEEIGCIVNDGIVTNMLPDLDTKWCHVGMFHGNELENLKKYCWDTDKQKHFGFEAINKIIEKGGEFSAVGSRTAKIIDVDCPKDLNIARELISD